MTGAQPRSAGIGADGLVAGTAPPGDKSSAGPNEGWVTGYLVLPGTPPTRAWLLPSLERHLPPSRPVLGAQPQEVPSKQLLPGLLCSFTAVFGCVYTCHCQSMSGQGLQGRTSQAWSHTGGRALGEGRRLGVRVSPDKIQLAQAEPERANQARSRT